MSGFSINLLKIKSLKNNFAKIVKKIFVMLEKEINL